MTSSCDYDLTDGARAGQPFGQIISRSTSLPSLALATE